MVKLLSILYVNNLTIHSKSRHGSEPRCVNKLDLSPIMIIKNKQSFVSSLNDLRKNRNMHPWLHLTLTHLLSHSSVWTSSLLTQRQNISMAFCASMAKACWNTNWIHRKRRDDLRGECEKHNFYSPGAAKWETHDDLTFPCPFCLPVPIRRIIVASSWSDVRALRRQEDSPIMQQPTQQTIETIFEDSWLPPSSSRYR